MLARHRRKRARKPAQHTQPAVTTTNFAESAQPAQPSVLELRSEVFGNAQEEVDDICQSDTTTTQHLDTDAQNADENVAEHVAENAAEHFQLSEADKWDILSDIWPDDFNHVVENNHVQVVVGTGAVESGPSCAICGELVEERFCRNCFHEDDISFFADEQEYQQVLMQSASQNGHALCSIVDIIAALNLARSRLNPLDPSQALQEEITSLERRLQSFTLAELLEASQRAREQGRQCACGRGLRCSKRVQHGAPRPRAKSHHDKA